MKKKRIIVLVFFLTSILLLHAKQSAYAAGKTDGKVTGCQIRLPVAAKVYQTSKSKKKIRKIPKGTVLEVIKYKNHRFYVEYKKKKGWIGERHVFINLVDYIPSIEYKLHLAKGENLFNIKGKPIQGVSKRRFYKSKGIRSGKQCWLNYIVAKKLLKAQNTLRKDGYSIVLYDAYRPQKVSESIYRSVSKSSLADKMGGPVEDYIALRSSHNKGVAVDMTIKNLRTERELKMPSKIMTLGVESSAKSWYNKSTKESRNARMLRSYMVNAGFTYLSTEWWHFQDGNWSKAGMFREENYYNISQ